MRTATAAIIARARATRPATPPAALAAALLLAACGSDGAVKGPNDAALADAVTADSEGDVAGDSAGAGDSAADAAKTCTSAADCPAAKSPCSAAVCQPGVGCVEVLLLDGSVCLPSDDCATGGSCKQGACVATGQRDCDDGNPCTSDGCAKGECLHSASDGLPCDDGEACTVGDACKGGACKAGTSTCDCVADADCAKLAGPCKGKWLCDKSAGAGTCKVIAASLVQCPKAPSPCLVSACDPETGACALQAVPDGLLLACDDGDACTSGDVCKGGGCVPGADVCGCKSDVDCLSKDDGDLCNGVPFCNKASKPASCELNPATIVSCPSVDDSGCSKNLCEPKSGACKAVAQPDQLPCDDGSVCTSGEACKGGVCFAEANTCTCQSDADCKDKDDGDLCNGTLFCDKSGAKASCKLNPATVVSCKAVDDTFCLANTCDPKAGSCALTPRNEALACNDGDPCTQGEVCKAGVCKASGGADLCSCTSDGDCGAFEDGDVCNGTLYCDKSAPPFVCKVNPKTIKSCSSAFDTACSKASCDAKSGACLAQPVNSGLGCDDGDPCTKGDFCQLGQCKGGVDVCSCKDDLDCASKDDGNLCNGTPFCDKSALPWLCKVNPATVISCNTVDDTLCKKTVCTPKTGLCEFVVVNQGVGCDDGDACVADEVCHNGGCKGQKVSCDDGVACTADACDPAVGCVAPAIAGFCDDDNACTVDSCVGKGKAAEKGVDALGCLHKAQSGGGCDDGDACSEGDTCLLGACKGKAKVCDDGNPCTDDSCATATGCDFKANSAGCKTDKPCQPIGVCAAGACVPQPSPMWQAVLDGKGDDIPAAVAGHGDGSAVVVGRSVPAGGKASDAQLWVAKLAAGGASVVYDLALGGAGDDAGLAIAAVDVGGGGKAADQVALVAGRRAAGSKGGSDAWLLRLGADGKTAWQQHVGGAGDDEAAALVAWGDGASAFAGRLGSGDGSAMWLGRVDAVGTVLWTATLPGKAGAAAAIDRQLGNKGETAGFVVAGQRQDKAGALGVAVGRVGADGVVAWSADVGVGKAQEAADIGRGVRALGDGGALVVAGSGKAGRLLRVGKGGLLDLDQGFGAGGGGSLRSLTAVRSGSATAVGVTKDDAGKAVVWLLHVGVDGSLLWQKTYGPAGAAALPAGTTFADGRLLFVAAHSDGKTAGVAARVVALDAFGHGDCDGQGACQAKSAADCDDANPCTFDTCSSELGCGHGVHTLPCDDGDPCSLGESCKAGACQAGKPACDDANPCTQDACALPAGCTHVVVDGACDDGNACTTGEACGFGVCKSGKLKDCDDGNVCTDDACDAKVGCTHGANTGPCDSGNCTVADACKGGICGTTGKSRYVLAHFGQTGIDQGFGLRPLADGGTVLVGRSYAGPASDGLIVRSDASGAKVWQTVVAASNTASQQDYFWDVEVTPFGLLAVGYTDHCGIRSWAVMFDEQGTPKWNSTFAFNNAACSTGNHRTYARAVASGTDGTYAMVGWDWEWPYGNSYEGSFIRVNQNGAHVSSKQGLGVRQLFDIAARPGGGYLAVAEMHPTGAYGYDARLMALDADGDPIWTRDLRANNTNVTDHLTSIVAGPDGGAIAAGYTGGVGARQLFVARVASTGAPLWQGTFGGSADELAAGLVGDPDGSATVAATTYSYGPGSGDLWLVRVDPFGNKVWDRVHGQASAENYTDLARRPDGSLAAVGTGDAAGASASDLQLRTVDAWGYGDCKSAGVCSAKAASACHDGNPCTLDRCLPIGCSPAAAPEAAMCAVSKTCKSGKCQ